jgi:hypothetical protein
MSSGWGVDALLNANGFPIEGTESQDVRRILGSLYTPGIVTGANVTTSGSSLNLEVAPGVVVINTGDGENVIAPVDATTVVAAPPPGSGSRTDIVYAQQLFPQIESSARVRVGIASELPERAVELDRFVVNVGNNTTSAFTRTGNRGFSVPLSQSGGILHMWNNKWDGVYAPEEHRQGHSGPIHFSTDRRVKISISVVMSAQNAVGFDNSKYVEWYFLPNIDGFDMIKWTTPGLHQAWATYYFEGYWDVTAGDHSFHFARGRQAGTGNAVGHYGVDANGHGRTGLVFKVEDAGPIA